MSFVCVECHEKYYKGYHISPISYGACEDCGKTKACYDCKCEYVPTNAKFDMNGRIIK